MVFGWNPPTTGAPNPAGQTLYSDSSNNIGIGTLSPSVKLEIYSTSSDSILKLSRGPSSTTSTILKVGTDSAFIIQNQSTDVLTIKSGNVGIGTTAPGAKFHVNSTDATNNTLAIFESDIDSGTEYNEIRFSAVGNSSPAAMRYVLGTVPNSSELAFLTQPDATGMVERVRINNSGLDINGTIRGATWGFGGIYTTNSGVCSSNNPLTGAQSCPTLFTAHEVGRFQHGGGIGTCDWTLSIIYACIR